MSNDNRHQHHALFVVLGNQLFPPHYLREHGDALIYMAEDIGLCTYVRHHQQKIVLFLAAMRSYRDELVARGFAVHYESLDGASPGYEEKLAAVIKANGADELHHFEIEDKAMEQRLAAFADAQGLQRREFQ